MVAFVYEEQKLWSLTIYQGGKCSIAQIKPEAGFITWHKAPIVLLKLLEMLLEGPGGSRQQALCTFLFLLAMTTVTGHTSSSSRMTTGAVKLSHAASQAWLCFGSWAIGTDPFCNRCGSGAFICTPSFLKWNLQDGRLNFCLRVLVQSINSPFVKLPNIEPTAHWDVLAPQGWGWFPVEHV